MSALLKTDIPRRQPLRLVGRVKEPTAPPVDRDVSAAAARYRDSAALFDEAEALKKIDRASLLELVVPRWKAQLDSGVPDATVKIPTPDGKRVLVMYVEKFKQLDGENIAPLKYTFGPCYSLFCEEATTTELVKGTTLAEIERAVCSCMNDDDPRVQVADVLAALGKLLVTTTTVAPRKGAIAHVAHLRKQGLDEDADDLFTLIEATINQPTVRAK